MASLGDRMVRSGPIWRAVYKRLNDLIAGHNELVRIVLNGQNPHKINDVTNTITLSASGEDVDDLTELSQQLITKYSAHIGDATHHMSADTTNTVSEKGVIQEVYILANELKVDYEAHRVRTASSVHAGTDTVNKITAENAITKATVIALINDIKTQFIANFADITSHHGAADTVGIAAATAVETLTETSTWTEIAAAIDALRAAYEAHRVLTAGSVHGGADTVNTVTATAIGTYATALYAGMNELKTDFNAHILESGTCHKFSDTSMTVKNADATTVTTANELVNELRTAYMDHISRADEVTQGPIVATLDEE